MTREKILATLHRHAAALRARGVKSLLLIGPAARGEISAKGDIDLILELHPPLTFDHYREVKSFLQQLLGHPVDLTMVNPRHPEVWPWIQDEAVEVLQAEALPGL
jgi:predicted nucleotidyltransferase